MSRVFRVTLSALLALCLSPFSSLAFADVVIDSESQYQEEDLQQDDIMTSDDLDESSASAADSITAVLQDSAVSSESQAVIVEQHAIEMNVINGDLGSVDVVANADGTPATLDPVVGDTVTLRAARADAGGKLVRMSCTYVDPKTGEEITRGLERQGSWDPDSNDYSFVMPAEKAIINVEWARA